MKDENSLKRTLLVLWNEHFEMNSLSTLKFASQCHITGVRIVVTEIQVTVDRISELSN